MSDLIHNDGPEHFCGLCRVGHHRAHATDKTHLEKLIVRCVVKNIVTSDGATALLESL